MQGMAENPHQYVAVSTEDSTPKVKLIVMGYSGVGKTNLLKQFLFNKFTEKHYQTVARANFYPSFVINDTLYNVKIVDCPTVSYFPKTSIDEWTDFRGMGLRNASGYIMVFDVNREETFAYIKNMREQMGEIRDLHETPIIVAANKHDLVSEKTAKARREMCNLVKKTWRSPYVECSVKYNWHVVQVFKETMKTIDQIDHKTPIYTLRMHEALTGERCTIM